LSDKNENVLPTSKTGGRSVRDRVVLFLLFLTSDACRDTLAQQIPEDRIIFELCRVWFDEIYVPGPRYLDGLKGDLSEERIAAFAEHFSDEEFAALERFHAFFELRMDMQPDRVIRDRSFPKSDLWMNIVRDARYVVEDLDPDSERRRVLIEWLTKKAMQDGSTASLSAASFFLDG
jgi:hypothetical protein